MQLPILVTKIDTLQSDLPEITGEQFIVEGEPCLPFYVSPCVD
jgi:hypothetical protein